MKQPKTKAKPLEGSAFKSPDEYYAFVKKHAKLRVFGKAAADLKKKMDKLKI